MTATPAPLRGARAALLLGTLIAAAPAFAQTLAGQPFHALGSGALAWGEHELSLGAEWRDGSYAPSPLLDEHDTGDLLRAPIVSWRLGFGRGELVIASPVGLAYWRDDSVPGGKSDQEEGFGDVEAWTKIEVVRDLPGRPGFGIALGAKFPNADDDLGLGSNEADLFLSFLLSETWGAHSLALNAGVAVVGNPTAEGAQQDMATLALAGVHGSRHAFAWEVWGRGFASSDRDLDEATVAVGYLRRGARTTLHAALLAGLVDNSGGLGARLSATWRIGSPR